MMAMRQPYQFLGRPAKDRSGPFILVSKRVVRRKPLLLPLNSGKE